MATQRVAKRRNSLQSLCCDKYPMSNISPVRSFLHSTEPIPPSLTSFPSGVPRFRLPRLTPSPSAQRLSGTPGPTNWDALDRKRRRASSSPWLRPPINSPDPKTFSSSRVSETRELTPRNSRQERDTSKTTDSSKNATHPFRASVLRLKREGRKLLAGGLWVVHRRKWSRAVFRGCQAEKKKEKKSGYGGARAFAEVGERCNVQPLHTFAWRAPLVFNSLVKKLASSMRMSARWVPNHACDFCATFVCLRPLTPLDTADLQGCSSPFYIVMC